MKKVEGIKKSTEHFVQLDKKELRDTSGGFIIHPVLPTHLIIQWVAKKFN